jgi:hypothetical protein
MPLFLPNMMFFEASEIAELINYSTEFIAFMLLIWNHDKGRRLLSEISSITELAVG